MIVQVYTAQTPEEAVDLARLGVDHVGVTVSDRGLPGEVRMSLGRAIVDAVRETPSRSVALTVETHLEEVESLIAELRPDIVHFCGDISVVGPKEVGELRGRLGRSGLSVEVMQAIGVTGTESVELAVAFAPHVDWLILDSVTDEVEGIGAAGFTHDWAVSRQIVEEVAVPVILAGGLGPDNVARAIESVRPAGVDSLTRTNLYRPNGTFVKDLEAVRRFVMAARQ
ncbi:MAG: phosphoribosylanthranilate isomerase [Acidimicrobiia bacterium]